MKKIFSVLLATSLILSASMPAFAVAPPQQPQEDEMVFSPRYRYIDECELSASKSGSKISATASIRITSNGSSSKTILTLEKSTGGSYSSAGTIQNTGIVTSKSYRARGDITASGRYSYRVKAVVYVYDSQGG